ncbi:sulfatase-like hydrolase/transferase [bacterium]|nr:sulfatase-like hydrolase/transferase [bacterium]
MKYLLVLCVALLPSLSLSAADAADISPRPNVVLFLVDDMGWMDCGVYGSQYYETPHIDGFAKRSMRFTDAYAQPLCSPTRASILTGQYSARHHVTSATGHLPPQPEGHLFLKESAPPNVPMLLPESQNYLDPSHVTLAETLKAAGYRTAHIGKWHLGTTQPHWPEQQGFDVAFHCHPDPGPPGNYFSPYGVTAEGTPTNRSKVGTITDGPPGEYIVDRQADEALRFLRAGGNEPFFLNLWCYGVHGPWGHKVEYTREFAAKQDPSGRQGNPIMASMLKSVDDCFGQILEELDRRGLTDNTIVIFYSDNGGNVHSNVPGTAKTDAAEKNRSEFLADWRKWAGDQPPTMNTPLRDGKGTLYEGGTRVPLMWAWPGRIQPGSLSDAVVGPIDLYPTLLSLLAIERPQKQVFDGVSYADVLTGRGSLHRDAYFNYHPHAGANRAGGVWVRSGDFKLLRWFGNPDTFELFNLRNDLSESSNLAGRQPEKVRELNAKIDRFLKDTGATYPRPNPAYRGPATQATVDPLDAWKQRGCTATIADGVLTMTGTDKPGTAFLGHAAGRMTGPATVKLRVRTTAGGAGRIDCIPAGASDPSNIFTTPFKLNPGDWQDISVELKHSGRLGVLRLYLPATATVPVEIDQIDIRPTTGRGEQWTF